MSDPTFGISITKIDNEVRPAVWSDMSVVGLVGTAPDADALVFPSSEAVFMYSDDATKLASLGDTGTLPAAIALLNAQLGDFQVAAKLVIVRVAESEDDAVVIGRIVDNGLPALRAAGPALGYIPRLIACPGYTSQRFTGVNALTIANQGTGYANGTFNLTASGGGGTGFTGRATVVAGKITTATILTPGTGYTSAPTISLSALTGGSGGSITATIALQANGVCAALPAHLSYLLAHAVVDGPATDQAGAEAWRESLLSERIIPVDPEVNVLVGGVATAQPSSPAVIGIAVRRDHQYGGRPFHSWANQPVYGIVGPSRPVAFSLTDGATEGQALLAANVGIIVRGELGVESAIASGGFVYIGTDNVGEDDIWRFYNVTRGRDYIHLMFMRTLRYYLGRYNITGQTITAIVNTMESAMRDLKADGDILGYKIGFQRDQNSPDELRLGRLSISFAAEEAPVLRYLGIQSARYRPALDALLDDLLTQVGTVTG